MSPSPTPEGPPAVHPVSCWPAVLAFADDQAARHPQTSHHPLQVGLSFRGFFSSLLLRPGDLLASRADRTSARAGPPETFTFGLSTIRSPSSSPNMTTVPTGQFTPTGLAPVRQAASFAALTIRKAPASATIAAPAPRAAPPRPRPLRLFWKACNTHRSVPPGAGPPAPATTDSDHEASYSHSWSTR